MGYICALGKASPELLYHSDRLKYPFKKSFEPLSRYRHRSWPDLTTNGWLERESISGKLWKELPDDYLVPDVNDPFDNCIIIGGGEEEGCIQLTGGRSGYGDELLSNPVLPWDRQQVRRQL